MSPEEVVAAEVGGAIPQEGLKEEFIGFLISTGRIRKGLASALYDAGLNDYKLLREGDVVYFTSFKGVGERTADALMELGSIRRSMELKVSTAAFEKALTDGKVRSNVIRILLGNGLDSMDKLLNAGEEGLTALKGIGPATARTIIDTAQRNAAPPPTQVAGGIEDAAGVSAPEDHADGSVKASDGQSSIIQRIGSFFKGLFGRSKEAPAPPSLAPKPEETEPDRTDEAIKEDAPTVEEVAQSGTSGSPHQEEVVVAGAVPKPEGGIHTEVSSTGPPEEGSDATAPVPGPLGDLPEASAETLPVATGSEAQVLTEGSPGPEAAPTQDVPVESPAEPVKKQGFIDRIRSIFKKPALQEKRPEATGEGSVPESAPVDVKAAEVPSADEAAAPEGPRPENPGPGAGEGSVDNAVPDNDHVAKDMVPERSEIKDISDIPDLPDGAAKLLVDAGYLNLDELREAMPEDLVLVNGIDEKMAKMIHKALHP